MWKFCAFFPKLFSRSLPQGFRLVPQFAWRPEDGPSALLCRLHFSLEYDDFYNIYRMCSLWYFKILATTIIATDMTITLSEETRLRLIGSIQRYFAENMDEPVGDLKAMLLLDFCVREIGPSIYNQAILDAQSYLHDKIAEMDGDCHETEFAYWRRK